LRARQCPRSALTRGGGDTKSKKHRFDEHKILYGKLRPYLNKVALPDLDGLCSTDVVPIQVKPGIERRYLAFYMRSREFVRITSLRATGNLPRAGVRILKRMPVPIAPPSEQHAVIETLEAADTLVREAAAARARVPIWPRRLTSRSSALAIPTGNPGPRQPSNSSPPMSPTRYAPGRSAASCALRVR
jgi:hypothetical protein